MQMMDDDFGRDDKEVEKKRTDSESDRRDGVELREGPEDPGTKLSLALRDLRSAVHTSNASRPPIDVPNTVSIKPKSKLHLHSTKKSTRSRFPWSSASRHIVTSPSPMNSIDPPSVTKRNSRSVSPKKRFRFPLLRNKRSKSSDPGSNQVVDKSSEKYEYCHFWNYEEKSPTKLKLVEKGSDSGVAGSDDSDSLRKPNTSFSELLKNTRKDSPKKGPGIPLSRKKGTGSKPQQKNNNNKNPKKSEAQQIELRKDYESDKQPQAKSKQPKHKSDAKTPVQSSNVPDEDGPSSEYSSNHDGLGQKQALPWSTFDEPVQPNEGEKRDNPTMESDENNRPVTASEIAESDGVQGKGKREQQSKADKEMTDAVAPETEVTLDDLLEAQAAEETDKQKPSLGRTVSQYLSKKFAKKLDGEVQNQKDEEQNEGSKNKTDGQKDTSSKPSEDESIEGPVVPEKLESYLAMATLSSGKYTDDDNVGEGVGNIPENAEKAKRIQALVSASFSASDSSLGSAGGHKDGCIQGNGCLNARQRRFVAERCFETNFEGQCGEDRCYGEEDDDDNSVFLEATRVVIPRNHYEEDDWNDGGNTLLCGLFR